MIAGRRFSFILLLIFVLILISGCDQFRDQDKPPEDLKKIDYKLYNFELEYYNFGELSWIFDADTVIVPIDEEYNSANNVKVSFYDKGELTSTLCADYGEYYILSGNIVAEGNVVVESVNEDKLLTSKLYWMEYIEEFWTDREVDIIRKSDNSTMKGLRMKADRRLTDIRIDVHIKTTINKPEEKNE